MKASKDFFNYEKNILKRPQLNFDKLKDKYEFIQSLLVDGEEVRFIYSELSSTVITNYRYLDASSGMSDNYFIVSYLLDKISHFSTTGDIFKIQVIGAKETLFSNIIKPNEAPIIQKELMKALKGKML